MTATPSFCVKPIVPPIFPRASFRHKHSECCSSLCRQRTASRFFANVAPPDRLANM